MHTENHAELNVGALKGVGSMFDTMLSYLTI